MAGQQPTPLKYHSQPESLKSVYFMDHQRMEPPNATVPKVAGTTPAVQQGRSLARGVRVCMCTWMQRTYGGMYAEAGQQHLLQHLPKLLKCSCKQGLGHAQRPSVEAQGHLKLVLVGGAQDGLIDGFHCGRKGSVNSVNRPWPRAPAPVAARAQALAPSCSRNVCPRPCPRHC